jgi:tRNA_anti-like
MKNIAIVIALIALVGGVVGYKMYNKPHENIADATEEHSLSAAELFAAYQADEMAANAKYLDKIIVVQGTVRETKEEDGTVNVMLETDDMMFGVRCQLDNLATHKRKDFKAGEKVSLKGKCSGSLMDVVMVRCVEI